MMEFSIGQIVYVVRRANNRLHVQIGIIDEIFNEHSVKVDYLTLKETRTINGVPIKEFNDDKYHKLPKGWDKMRLYKLGHEPIYEEIREAALKTLIEDTKGIKQMYDKGYFVKIEDTFTGHIEVDITKDGYRVYKSYYQDNVCTGLTYPVFKVYAVYEEAQDFISAYYDELDRQANLSDEEWSLEQIDKELARWQGICNKSDRDVQKIREYLLDLGDVTSIEIRMFRGNIEWKREKNLKWTVVPDDLRW